MRTAVEPVRWRHRPLLFYALSQGVGRAASAYMMRARGYARRREGELTYWYRAAAPLPDGARAPEPLVFIHGVGFGPAPYLAMVDRFAGGGAAVLLVELTAASQCILPRMPPTPTRFAELLDAALERLRLPRAVLVGHSLGSAYASYATQFDAQRSEADGLAGRRRYGGVVYIDPIACNVHHARTTREFVYTRVETPQRSFED